MTQQRYNSTPQPDHQRCWKHITSLFSFCEAGRTLILTLLLMMVSVGAWGATYVLKNSTATPSYIAFDEANNKAIRVETFDEATCVWTCALASDGTTDAEFTDELTFDNPVVFYFVSGGTKYYLSTGEGRVKTTIGATEKFYWRDGVLVNSTQHTQWYTDYNYFDFSLRWNDTDIPTSQSYSATGCVAPELYEIVEPIEGGYVIYNGSVYLGGANTNNITSFNPKTCIWAAESGAKLKNGSGYYFRARTTLTLTNSANQAANVTIDLDESGTTGLRLSYSYLINTYYLRYNNGWNVTTTQNQAGRVVYEVKKEEYSELQTNPSIGGADVISRIGADTYEYGSVGERYRPAYNNYIFYNGTDHYFSSDDNTPLNSEPQPEDFTYQWSLSANAAGHVTLTPIDDGKTCNIVYTNYFDDDTDVTISLVATSMTTGKILETATKTITFQYQRVSPIAIATDGDKTLYVDNDYTIDVTLTPTNAYRKLTFTSADDAIASIDANGRVTANAIGTTTITVQAETMDGDTPESLKTEIEITVKDKVAAPEIAFAPQADPLTALATISTTTIGASIYYTIDGEDPTSASALYSGPFVVNNLQTVRAIAIMTGANVPYYDNSEVSVQMFSAQKVPTPVINVRGDEVTFSCYESGVTYYYTTDGSDPTTSSTVWDGNSFTASAGGTIKVIAAKTGFAPSEVARRTLGTAHVVYLNLNATRNGNGTKDSPYNSWESAYGALGYGPNAEYLKGQWAANGLTTLSNHANIRNVTDFSNTVDNNIIYLLGNVSADQLQNLFSVTYSGGTGARNTNSQTNNSYTTCTQNALAKGFMKPATISGKYADGGEVTITYPLSSNTTLNEDTRFEHINFRAAGTNDLLQLMCAYYDLEMGEGVRMSNMMSTLGYTAWDTGCPPGSDVPHLQIFGGYQNDRRFGSSTNSELNFDKYLPHPEGFKIVFRSGYYSTVCVGGKKWDVTGINGMMGSPTTPIKCTILVDIDHAYNESVASPVTNGHMPNFDIGAILAGNHEGAMYGDVDIIIKSGRIGRVVNGTLGANRTIGNYPVDSYFGRAEILIDPRDPSASEAPKYPNKNAMVVIQELYGGALGRSADGAKAVKAYNYGKSSVTINGGTFLSALYASGAGGVNGIGDDNHHTEDVRLPYMNGTNINYGTYTQYKGGTKLSVTCHLDRENILAPDFHLDDSSIDETIDLSDTNTEINIHGGIFGSEANPVDGIFGGGFGFANQGLVNYTDNTIVPNVQAGSLFGKTGSMASHVTIDGDAVIYGNVYGAGRGTDIYYTSSRTDKNNYKELGIVNGNVELSIAGNAKIYGSVYGAGQGVENTNLPDMARLYGNTTLTIGENAVITGDVYGGGANGSVNGNTEVNIAGGTENQDVYGGGALANISGNTEVNLTSGTIKGSVYGGGLGRLAGGGKTAIAALVNGNATVTLDGAIVEGSIFGANNVNGTPQGHALVHVKKTTAKSSTDGDYHVDAVYGGGNQADYVPTSNTDFAEVVVDGCDNNIEYVYGGGNAAAVPESKVTINGGTFNYVFAGGNGAGAGNPGADVGYKNHERTAAAEYGTGNASAIIHAGIIEHLFAGSNSKGDIRGSQAVSVDHSVESCNEDIKEVYGGGNLANSKAGTVNIGCGAEVGDVYGGANQANITGDIELNITGGKIDRVFGGNNTSGSISGTITVNVNKDDECEMDLSYVYGAGNQAAYSPTTPGAYPAVNIIKGTVNHDVFGGGLGTTAIVTSNPTVTISGGAVNGSVYGGGALANVTGDTYVILNGGEVGEDVFGGGKGELYTSDNTDAEHPIGMAKTFADVSGATHVTVNGGSLKFPENGIDPDVNHNIYGGGNLACKVNASNVTMNAGILPADFFSSDPWQKSLAAVSAQNDNVVQGSVFGGGYGVYTSVNTTATVDVNVARTATNKSILDVVGGGYNGYVFNNTDITIAGDVNLYKVYGGGLGSLEGYAVAPTTARTGSAINTFSMKETIGSVGEGKEGDGTNVTINGGKIYSNIYGGGAGLKSSTDPANEYLNVAEVFGKSHVTIDAIAGWTDADHAYSHSIYGGGALGLVNDAITVDVMSGTMAGAEIFAGSLGEKGHLDKAKVTKGASIKTLANGSEPVGALQGYFNIYGGCDMAQMVGNTDVDIKHGTFSGSIFGAGKGLPSEGDEEYLQYGKVTGATTIEIDAPNVVLGQADGLNADGTIKNANQVIKIYGGGALGLVDGKINPVTLKSGTLYGEVFGGSLGELGHPNKAKISLTDGETLGVLTTISTENKDGEGNPAALNGNINIYGGCDMAVVEGNTQVEITHGTFTGQMFGGGKGVATTFDGSNHDLYADHGMVKGETTIIYNNDGTFNGNVYGGGALGSVIPSATPVDGYTTEIYLMKGILNGHVFGGGFGENANVEKAKVVGNTFITTREMDDPDDVLSGEMNHIYGGGDMAMVDGDTNLDFTRGKFNGEIFGGGHGIEEDPDTEIGDEKYQDFGKVTGTTHVVIDGGQLGTNNENDDEKIRIYGGGALGLVGGIDIVVKSGEHYGEVFGGSLGEFGHPNKAIVNGNSFVSTIANKLVDDNPSKPADDASPLTGNIKFYGGCNQSQVTGNSSVTINYGTFSGAVFGGGKGVSGSDVYGKIGGNASVLMMAGNTKDADVYGGCALGVVVGNTSVDLAGGEVKDVYGGGLGDANTKAFVNGEAVVALNGSSVTGATNDCKVYGSIFGCNNVNGTPVGQSTVHIYKTTAKGTVGEQYHVAAVYGGGNNAAYEPAAGNVSTRVIVDDCDSSIEYVYGGGNAAPVPGTSVTINGANSIANVFGGGNGAGAGNPGANVGWRADNTTSYGPGTAVTTINGGTITNVYGGSNTKGLIRTSAEVKVEQNSSCELVVANIFAAGNEAEMFCDGILTIGCIDKPMEEIYGGSNNANITGNITLNITNGKFGKVFGGNNMGGNITGKITVNIDETGCHPVEIDELYCCGNKAAYSVYGYNDDGSPKTSGDRVVATDPTINIISFTRIGSVFGGGLGEDAKVYGNTNININPIPGKFAAQMTENEKYGITHVVDDAVAEGKTYSGTNCGIIDNVYGGGSEAVVYGNTNITIGSKENNSHVTGGDDLIAKTYDVGVNITGNIYGGGKKAAVTGDTNVKIGK